MKIEQLPKLVHDVQESVNKQGEKLKSLTGQVNLVTRNIETDLNKMRTHVNELVVTSVTTEKVCGLSIVTPQLL